MKVVKLANKRICNFDWTTILVVFIVLMKNCLYLLDVETFEEAGVFNYSDIWMILLVAFIVFVLVKYRNYHLLKSEFGWIIIIQILLCFLSAIQENRLTGQSFMMGLRPQRFRIVIMLCYFPLRKIFILNKITICRIKKILVKFAILEAVLSIIQQLVYNYFVFMHCRVSERYGSIRLYLSTSVIVFAMFISMNEILKKKSRTRHYVMLILGFIYLLFVVKSRWQFISIVIALLIGILLIKKISKRKIAFSALLIIGFIVLLRTPMVSDILSFKDGSIQESENLDIRLEGRELYFHTISKHPILGGGYPNDLYKPASSAAGIDQAFMLNDNGVFGYMYLYGLLGVIALLYWYIKMFVMAVKTYRKKGEYLFIMYLVMQVIASYTSIWWLWVSDAMFIMVIFMCMLEKSCGVRGINILNRINLQSIVSKNIKKKKES